MLLSEMFSCNSLHLDSVEELQSLLTLSKRQRRQEGEMEEERERGKHGSENHEQF